MIVSFHPLFKGDTNLLCAGREPGHQDLVAIRSASAVILPQGCPRSLYEMARANCSRVFPNYDARFRYPGKTGQIRLFRESGAPHPETEIYTGLSQYGTQPAECQHLELPFVFKFDWGGEGDTVFLVHSRSEFEELLDHADRCERSGQRGFLIQKFIDCGGRSLRVVVIGDRVLSYWRVADSPESFKANLSKGAMIDAHSDPDLKREAERMVAGFCRANGINLAGLDVIYDLAAASPAPMLLEINYYFGRVGLGGSEAYYAILKKEMNRWLRGVRPV
jgi:ribosomal protein S6--L-glutamate ligase